MRHQVVGAISTVLTVGVGTWAIAVLPVVPALRRLLFFALTAAAAVAFTHLCQE